MEIVLLMVPMALGLGAVFLILFIWITRSGQYDDLETPAIRMLLDEEKPTHSQIQSQKEHP